MANGVSTADILRPISVDVLYNPPAVEQSYSEGTGFWNTTKTFLGGLVDQLPKIAETVVQYFPPPTSSAARTVAYPTTVPRTTTVAPLYVPPSSRPGAPAFPPLVSDAPGPGGDAFAGVTRNTLLLLGAGAVALLFLVRR